MKIDPEQLRKQAQQNQERINERAAQDKIQHNSFSNYGFSTFSSNQKPSVDLVKTDDVHYALKTVGPSIPTDIKAFLKKGDSITIGAALSELAERKLAKVTNVKRGGSPFYYVSGQEPKLETLGQYLGEKDRRTFELLKTEQIIEDKTQEPLTRVSLRNIPDFAKQVIIGEGEEQKLFWRWYQLEETEARKQIAEKQKTSKKTQIQEVKKEIEETKPEQQIIEKKKEIVVEEIPKIKSKPKSNEEKEKELIQEKIQEKIIHEEKTAEKQSVLVETKEGKEGKNVKDVKEMKKLKTDDFLEQLKLYFQQKQITIKENVQIKKGEYDLILEMNTAVGKAEYFCKAKSKKKCNEGDLSTAYLQAQNKRLPAMFITSGEVIKKAKEKLKTDFKGMLLVELQ